MTSTGSTDADMFGKVSVNGKVGPEPRRGGRGHQKSVTNPGWAYGATVPLTGTVPVTSRLSTRTARARWCRPRTWATT